MKSIKAAFFDLDGTIYSFQTHEISQKTKEALIQLQKNGIQIAVASTRPLATVGQIEGIFDIPWNGFVTANGLEIWDAHKRSLMDNGFSSGQLKEIFRVAKANDIPVYTGGPDGVFYTMDTPAMRRHQTRYNIPVNLIKPYENEKQTLITLISDEPINAELFSHIEGIHLVRSHTYDLDVIKDGITKSYGIAQWMKMNGFPEHDYMAFGDSLSDRSMLENATIGVAMADGEEKVKEIADAVCPSCQEEGIEYFLKTNGFI